MSPENKQRKTWGNRPLPLVRLGLIQPFVAELDRLDVTTDAVLNRAGLERTAVADPDVFVPVIVVHRFLEDAAQAAGDPFLGVRVGESMDVSGWPPLVDAAAHAGTVGEFLTRFILAARDEASSAYHCLEIGADHAVFREIRTTEQEIAPAQNDAFTAAFTLGLLRRGAGRYWQSGEVLLTICDPRALPRNYLGIGVVGGNRMGMVVRFPSDWLTRPLDPTVLSVTPLSPETRRSNPPRDFVQALRQTLRPHLHEEGLNAEYVAHLTGMSTQTLQRRLRASGTTLSRELLALKKDRAMRELARSRRPVAEVGASIGFSNPTSFSRAFRTWTGCSPRQYRKQQPVHPQKGLD